MRPLRLTVLALIVVVLLAPASLRAQVTPALLGPRDGAGLAPADTGRVAVGSAAPDFALLAKDGGVVTLSQFRGKKNIILVFYRGHW